MAKNTMKKNYEMPVAEIVEFENIFAKLDYHGNNNNGNSNGFGSSFPWGDNNVTPID